MALAVTATLVGSAVPQAVQIAVTGATIGDSYTITGADGAGDAWTIRGGDSTVAVGTSIVLADVATPINTAITYTVTHDADAAFATASPVTVPYTSPIAAPNASSYVLSTLDGSLSAAFLWMNNQDPLETPMRNALFYIPGRAAPVVRYDVPGADIGTLQLLTESTQTPALKTVLTAQGGLCMLRTDGTLADFPSVQFLAITNNQRILPGAGTERVWTLAYATIGDPEPDAVVAAVDWDDFDLPWSTDTWTSFNTSWASGTWDGFDRFDWTTL